MSFRGIKRRDLMAAAGGATLLGGLALAGCGPARTTAANTWPTLVFGPDPEVTRYGSAEQKIVAQFLEPFEQQNHVHITLAPNARTPAAILGGDGADILWNLNYSQYISQGLLLDLTKYLKTDSISTTIWPKGQMDQLQTSTGTYALPYNFQPMVYFVNLSDFDSAGLPYPDASWTFDDFVKVIGHLKQANTASGYYGADIMWADSDSTNNDWVFHAYGGSTVNQDSTQVTIASSEGIAAGKWIYEQLLWPKIARQRGGLNDITNHTVSMELIGTWNLLALASELPSNVKWIFLPFPIGPKGRFTYAVNEFYGINVTTKHPDLSWMFLKWLTVEPQWQRDLMKLILLPPSINSLWPEWAATVGQAAPSFANKGLNWYTDAVQKGYAIPQVFFAYDDTQAQSTLNQYYSELGNQSIQSVTEGFTQAQTQINTMETQAANSPQAQLQKVLNAANGGPFAAPSQTGMGSPSVPAGSLIQSTAAGTYTLTGVGWDVWGIQDACTFAGAAQTAYDGTWTLQVNSLANVSEQPGLSGEAQAGLMARQDLSDDAAFAAIAVCAGGGIKVVSRHAAGDNPGQTLASTANPHGTKGLIPPANLFKTGATGTANILKSPVWLQLRRKGTVWTAWTSLDGKTFTQASGTMDVVMAGTWVGAYATAGNVDTGNQGETTASFSGLSFKPTQLVQLGASAQSS